MARVEIAVKKKPTAAEKRVAAAIAAAEATKDTPARRGESDDDELAPLPVEVPEEAAVAPVVHVPPQSAVVKSSEEENPFQYVEPPEDADPLEQIGMVRRGIARANRGLANGLGRMQRDYILSAGEYLWWATQGTRLRDAGFKSVEKFAEPLGLTKQDVYRLRRAVPVYRVIGDLVEEALNERTIRELYQTLTNERGDLEVTSERQENLRQQFAEMKRMGRVNSGGAVAARKLLMLGEATDVIEAESGSSKPGVLEQFTKARRTRRIVDLELLRDAKSEDPTAAREYVDELRRFYEAAAEIVG